MCDCTSFPGRLWALAAGAFMQPTLNFKDRNCNRILLIFCQKADLHQSHGPDWQGFALEVPVHLRGCRPRRGLHTRPHSRVHPARRGAATTFLICTLSRALLHAGIHEVALHNTDNDDLIRAFAIFPEFHGVSQVPEIVHYRESHLDMSIIVFILGVNLAEFFCHIFIFRARLTKKCLPLEN